MTAREIMEALLAGKKLRREDDSKAYYMHLRENGHLYTNCGYRLSFGDLGSAASRGRMVEYVEPNPHPKGTFSWAREEVKRGNKVATFKHRLTGFFVGSNECPDFSYAQWTTSEIDDLTWEIVK